MYFNITHNLLTWWLNYYLGEENVNRATDGDVVAIELLPFEEEEDEAKEKAIIEEKVTPPVGTSYLNPLSEQSFSFKSDRARGS